MYKTTKSAISMLLALMLVICVLPASGLGAVREAAELTAPDGYNANDYGKLAAFLEQTDEAGIKNGEKLSDNYDPALPKTWGDCFEWAEEDGELRIALVHIQKQDVVGTLDLSDCTALYVRLA